MTTAQPLDRVEQIDAIRDDLKALIEKGYLRWTHKGYSVDDFPDDESLPVELTGKLLVLEVNEEQEAELLAFFGVADGGGIQRVVNLSERSDLSCPMHGFKLLPDACRSCRFLAGEIG